MKKPCGFDVDPLATIAAQGTYLSDKSIEMGRSQSLLSICRRGIYSSLYLNDALLDGLHLLLQAL
jgi:hypothetical protein